MDKKHMSVRQRWEAGKGSRRRPCDEEKVAETFAKLYPDKKPWYEDRDMSWLEGEDHEAET